MNIKTRSNFVSKYLLILIKIPECTRLFTYISASAIIVVAINKLQFVILWLDEFFFVKIVFIYDVGYAKYVSVLNLKKKTESAK